VAGTRTTGLRSRPVRNIRRPRPGHTGTPSVINVESADPKAISPHPTVRRGPATLPPSCCLGRAREPAGPDVPGTQNVAVRRRKTGPTAQEPCHSAVPVVQAFTPSMSASEAAFSRRRERRSLRCRIAHPLSLCRDAPPVGLARYNPVTRACRPYPGCSSVVEQRTLSLGSPGLSTSDCT